MKPLSRFVIRLLFICAFLFLVPHTRAGETTPETEPPRPIYTPLALRSQNHLPPPDSVLPSSPDASPEAPLTSWQKLAFYSYRSDNWDVYRNDMEGGSDVRLTTDSHDDIEPRLNRGCTRIVFVSDRKEGNYHIYSMNLDGSDVKQLTSGDYDNYSPDWSPDGTKIVFESYRDGDDPEIYVMNADGSSETRLTTDSDYDGMPAWSPDGSKIAFISHRTGGYRVYTMNPDGSAQTILNSQYYSAHPQWSPDGSQIAYDSDGDNDGWQEIWLMNADGASQREIYDTGSYIDSYVSSWSPDGAFVAFTYVHWIEIGGFWYWDTAYLYKAYVSAPWIYLLGTGNTDWDADWQSTDFEAPLSSMPALPTISPAGFLVSWSGSDSLSGLKNFDVQVRDGVSGIWTDWLIGTTATTGSYTGLGGHSYYFRARAHDNGGNIEAWPADYDTFTTVESQPPVSSLTALQGYTRGAAALSWSGRDYGNSGIQGYDVQYQDLSVGVWTNWLVGTTATSGNFAGTDGHTYLFHVRATDKAQNVESWPEQAEAQTTFYSWHVSGAVSDNVGTPVRGAQVNISPGGISKFSSDAQGNYVGYATSQSNYAVSWEKEGYTDLPATAFDSAQDGSLSVTLAPGDNLIADWGFESGASEAANWSFGGTITPVVTDTIQHTGDYAVILGQQGGFSAPTLLMDAQGGSWEPQMVIDDDGNAHAVWAVGNMSIYAASQTNGVWSAPIQLTIHEGMVDYPQITLDRDGIVHVLWAQNTVLYYVRRDPVSSWSSAQIIYDTRDGLPDSPRMALDGNGVLHVLFREYDNQSYISYLQRDESGVWSTSVKVASASNYFGNFVMGVDASGAIHAILDDNAQSFYYIQRSADGVWSSSQEIRKSVTQFAWYDMAVAPDGEIHLVWVEAVDDLVGLYGIRRDTTGVWSNPETITSGFSWLNFFDAVQLAITPNGSAHLVWGEGIVGDDYEIAYDIYYAQRESGGPWSTASNISNMADPGWAGNAIITLPASEQSIHVAFSTPHGSSYWDVYYLKRDSNGIWSQLINVSNNNVYGYSVTESIALDPAGNAHILWTLQEDLWESDLFYTSFITASQDGASLLSQVITIPLTMTNPTLSFYYELQDASATDDTALSVQVNNGLTNTVVLSTTTNASSWTHHWLDMSAWAGSNVTLTFTTHQAAGAPYVSAYLDEISLGSAYPDLWVNIGGRPAFGYPGDEVVFTLIYGNRSVITATTVLLTNTLPSDLTFLSASIPPTITNQTLSWEVGDLPPNSGPFILIVTTTLSADAPLMSNVTNTVSIANGAGEIETANNTAEAVIFIGDRVHLPVILR